MRHQAKGQAYQYKHLELALAQTFKIRVEDLPAFRARIRHLRNLGVPKLAKPGSGQKVTYTRPDAIQLLVALEAELLGLPPKQAASFSRAAMDSLVTKAEAAAEIRKPYFLSVEPTFSFNENDAAVFISNPDNNLPVVDNSTHRRTLINLATSLGLLDYYLKVASGEITTSPLALS